MSLIQIIKHIIQIFKPERATGQMGSSLNGHGPNGLDPKRARENGLEPEKFTTLSYHFSFDVVNIYFRVPAAATRGCPACIYLHIIMTVLSFDIHNSMHTH